MKTSLSNDNNVRFYRISNYEDLFLALSGSCIEQSPEETVLSFQTAVRCSTDKEIKVTNPTSQVWRIQPIISSHCWTGAKFLNIPPNQSAEYVLSYVPMKMTESSPLPFDEDKNQGMYPIHRERFAQMECKNEQFFY